MSIVKVDEICNTEGIKILNLNKISPNGFYTRKLLTQIFSNDLSFSTSWVLGKTFDIITDFQAGSLVKLDYHVPGRKDATTWGGIYIEPQVNFNNEGWKSLGSSGYDVVMRNGAGSIASYFQSIIIDPNQLVNFSTQFRFYFKSYDGTSMVNLSHDINKISGTAPLLEGNNGLQHFMHIIVEELARYS